MNAIVTQLSNVSAEIRRIRDAYRTHDKERIALALEGGARLLEARDACAYGAWTAFLRDVGLTPRRARDWMALARAGVKPATVAVFGGVRSTLEWLREDGFDGERANAMAELCGHRAEPFLSGTYRARALWCVVVPDVAEAWQAFPDGPLSAAAWLRWEARDFEPPWPWATGEIDALVTAIIAAT